VESSKQGVGVEDEAGLEAPINLHAAGPDTTGTVRGTERKGGGESSPLTRTVQAKHSPEPQTEICRPRCSMEAYYIRGNKSAAKQ
jgi:hypothetical protein